MRYIPFFCLTAVIATAIFFWPTMKEECNITVQPGTWQPVGWNVEDGFPNPTCVMPYWGTFHEDGTWEPYYNDNL